MIEKIRPRARRLPGERNGKEIMIREKRRKKRQIKNILIGFLGVLIALAVLALIEINVFRVTDVEIEGNLLYDDDVIRKAVLNDDYSWNSLYVFLKYRFTDTDAVPFVDTMTVTLKNPGTLHIQVYEKGIMGYLYIPTINENAYFDKDGFVVETSSEIIEGTPKIDGIDCGQVVLYEKLPIEKGSLRELLTLTQALKRSNLVPDAIVYGQAYSPVLVYGSVQIRMGPLENLTQKVERIGRILPSLEGKTGVLHLETWNEESANIVFDQEE